MSYGTPRATASTYHDQILCLTCSCYAHTHMGDRKGNEFFFWLRDEVTLEEIQTAEQDEQAFAHAVGYGRVRDGFSDDPENRLTVLCEGQAGEQDILNESHCEKCGVSLKSLCTEYP